MAVLLFALLVGADQTAIPARLDASSDAALERTTAAVRAGLAASQRSKFDQAIKILMADIIGKQDPNATKEHVVAGLRAALQGKTAHEVLTAAEATVRKMLDEYARKQATTVSRPLPPAAATRGPSFVCESLLSTSINPQRADEAEYFEITETTLLKPDSETRELLERQQLAAAADRGTDVMAIEIDNNNVKFITRASVEIGQASPALFAITKNDESVLLAVALDETLFGVVADSLLLNKKNGLAVWTKSRSASILGDQPTTQSLYLRCR
jgi:hypothetical protein